jgi:plasmid stabilization system protein ParE
MGEPTSALVIVYSARAVKDLDAIWDYNAEYYGSARRADDYVGFLQTEIRILAVEPRKGKSIEINPRFRYLLMKWSLDGHGHIAVYRVTKSAIRISRIFHTAQDWETKMKPRSPS